jgi:SAM-dependent methyltransferase
LPASAPGASAVAVPCGGGGSAGFLAVASKAGVADLRSAVFLSRSAHLALTAIEKGADEDELSDVLAGAGAETPERARSGAQEALRELRARGLLPAATHPSVSSSAAPSLAPPPVAAQTSDPVAIGASDLAALARAVLGRGLRLRFQASGRSMRPFVPHGSVLEVEPYRFGDLQRGDVVLYCAEGDRLVAHRVIATGERMIRTRGDSSARIDEVAERDVLGRVASCFRPTEQGPSIRGVSLTALARRQVGLLCGALYQSASESARAFLIRPMRSTFRKPSLVRTAAGWTARAGSGALLLLERGAARLRRPIDRARAALMTTPEKDEQRACLYRKSAVQGFTALEENLTAGLTLLEEVLLARHVKGERRALVLGCGPGRECFALAERGLSVVGLDREEGMLARARELAAQRAQAIQFVQGEIGSAELPGGLFDVVVIFSGLYNMILPARRRIATLRAARDVLSPGGAVWITFLSAYVRPGMPEEPAVRSLLGAINPEHEEGDELLLNECIHVFPRTSDIEDEAVAAGLEVEALHRDQRAYDRAQGRVRGYAVLRKRA